MGKGKAEKNRFGFFVFGFWLRPLNTKDHFLTDTTKDEKWLVLVGRPSLAASELAGTEARPTELFSYKVALKNLYEYSCHSERSVAE